MRRRPARIAPAFNREVFPKIKSEYIDTGKVRYVFREFPLNLKDAACSMLARRIAKDDSGKYFAVVDVMFKQQDQLVENTTDTLKLIGKQAGLERAGGRGLPEGSSAVGKINADRKFARRC